MKIVVCCATPRGLCCLERIAERVPEAELAVMSFPEAPGEPPFLEDIRAAATARGAPFHVSRRLEEPELQPLWAEPVDLLLAIHWRTLLRPEVFRRPLRGSFTLHDSLLPAYRGFSPTVWAMIHGEERVGATLFEIGEAVDDGDMVDQRAVPVGRDETIAEVMDKVTGAYLELIDRNLEGLLCGTAPRRRVDASQASFTCRRVADDNRVAWSAPTRRVHDLVRAVTRPYPGAFTTLCGERLTIWSASPIDPAPAYVGRVPGRVVGVRAGEGAVVLTGDGCLLVREVQLEGGEPRRADELLRSLSITLGR